MSAELQTAVANETMELSHAFRENLALIHGLPKPHAAERISKLDTDPAAPPSPQPINITNNIPAAPAATSSPSPGAESAPAGSSLLRKAAPFLIGLGVAGPAGYAAKAYLNRPTPAVQQTEQQKDGSLLQVLQDRGLHLKGGAWPTK